MAKETENKTTKSTNPRTSVPNLSEKKRERIDEANKFTFEVAKHITTLDSGIIVVFASLNPNWLRSASISSNIDWIELFLGLATIATFLISIVLCVFVMFLIPYQLRDDKVVVWQNWSVDGVLVIGSASFIAGIVLIIITASIKLFF